MLVICRVESQQISSLSAACLLSLFLVQHFGGNIEVLFDKWSVGLCKQFTNTYVTGTQTLLITLNVCVCVCVCLCAYVFNEIKRSVLLHSVIKVSLIIMSLND